MFEIDHFVSAKFQEFAGSRTFNRRVQTRVHFSILTSRDRRENCSVFRKNFPVNVFFPTFKCDSHIVRHTARVLRKHVAKHGVTSDVALASSRSSRDEGLACKPNHDNAPMHSDERGCKRVNKSKMSCFAKPQEAVSLSRSAKTQGQHLRRMTDLLYAVRLGWSRTRSGTAHLFTPPSPHHFLDTDRS